MEQFSSPREPRKSFRNKGFPAILAKGNDMARRRYQQGRVYEQPKGSGIWYGRYYESVIMPDGGEYRIRRNQPLGKFPTKKLAQRALEPELTRLNRRSYRPLRQCGWAEFSEQWTDTMLRNYKPSGQSSIKSYLKVLGWFDKIPLSDLDNLEIQRFISKSEYAPTTIKNQIAHMRSMWRSAKAWHYVDHNPFEGIVLPRDEEKTEQPVYSPEQVRKIILAARPPYNTVVWVLAETGMRRGELCGLNVEDVNLEGRYISIRRNCFRKHLTKPKSRKPRTFPISDLLAETLAAHMKGRPEGVPLFLTSRGLRLDPDNLVKRVLKPILVSLGLKGACHAFRHGNITQMGVVGASPAVMQQRVGHADFETTMIYMHVVSEDARRVANALGRLYAVDLEAMETSGAKQ